MRREQFKRINEYGDPIVINLYGDPIEFQIVVPFLTERLNTKIHRKLENHKNRMIAIEGKQVGNENQKKKRE